MGAAHTKIKKKGKIKRKKSVVDEITSSIKLDPKLVDEIIEMEI